VNCVVCKNCISHGKNSYSCSKNREIDPEYCEDYEKNYFEKYDCTSCYFCLRRLGASTDFYCSKNNKLKFGLVKKCKNYEVNCNLCVHGHTYNGDPVTCTLEKEIFPEGKCNGFHLNESLLI
jgi:hypothetical protein